MLGQLETGLCASHDAADDGFDVLRRLGPCLGGGSTPHPIAALGTIAERDGKGWQSRDFSGAELLELVMNPIQDFTTRRQLPHWFWKVHKQF